MYTPVKKQQKNYQNCLKPQMRKDAVMNCCLSYKVNYRMMTMNHWYQYQCPSFPNYISTQEDHNIFLYSFLCQKPLLDILIKTLDIRPLIVLSSYQMSGITRRMNCQCRCCCLDSTRTRTISPKKPFVILSPMYTLWSLKVSEMNLFRSIQP